MISNRNKFIIGLLTITLALGAFVFMSWMDNDDSIYRFRMLLLHDPRQLLRELWVTSGETGGLWYGAMALGAIVVTGLALTTLNSAERRIFRERLVALEVAKAEIETSLQDSLWREKHARGAKDAAAKELQDITDRFMSLQQRLIEAEKVAKRQERELTVLRAQSRVSASEQQQQQPKAADAAEERRLRDEFTEKSRLLEAREAELKHVQQQTAERVSGLEAQLGAQEELLKRREQELRAVRAQLAGLETAKSETQSALANELRREREAARAKESAHKEQAQALQAELNEKQELLKAGAAERERLTGELKVLGGQVTEKTAAGERLEKLLQQEMEKTQLLQRQDLQVKQVVSDLKGRIAALQAQFGDKEALLKERVSERDVLKRDLAALQAAQSRSEAAFRRELDKAKEVLESREASAREREQQLGKTIDRLESQVKERESLLKRRDGDLAALKTEIAGLTAQFSGKNAAGRVSDQDLSPLVKQLEKKLAESVSAMESELSVKANLIKEREQDLQTLKGQLAAVEAAKSQVESRLAADLESQKQQSTAKEAAMQALEIKFSDQLRAISSQLSRKEELLQTAAAEQEKLRGELNEMGTQLADKTDQITRMEQLLRQEIDKQSQAVQAKEAALQQLDNQLQARIRRLESELGEKDKLFKSRAAELDALKIELADMQGERSKKEESLGEEFRRLKDAVQTREQRVNELEGALTRAVGDLELRLKERDALLQSRDGEIASLKTEIAGLTTRLAAYAAAHQTGDPDSEDSSSDLSPRALENNLKQIRNLERLLAEKDDLLGTYDEKLSRVEAELKEKRTALARHEISVWQGIERRDLWKRRLSKVGIKLKD